MLPTIRYRTPVLRDRVDSDFGFERLIDGFFGPALAPRVPTRGAGAANLYETDEQFVLELEVPGFTKEDVEVTVERGVLTVSGSHEEQRSEDEGAKYYVRERSVERFSRGFRLPESVSSEGVVAELESGVLTVRLPKAAEAKPHRVEVTTK
jgi:HSP20 family protein